MNRQPDGTYHGSDYDSAYFGTQSDVTETRDFADQNPQPQSHSRSHRHNQSRGSRRDFSFAQESEDMSTRTPLTQSRTHNEHSSSAPRRTDNRRRERERRRELARQRAQDREEDRARRAAQAQRGSSPRKHDRRTVPGHYSEPLDLSSANSRSDYQYSTVDGDESVGTKSYHHPIAGLTKGYRRDGGGRRRRDSLDDSD